MDTLPRQFTATWFCGVWEKSTIKCRLERKFYRVAVLIVIHIFTLSQITQFFLTYESFENFVEIYDSLIYIVYCWKVVNFLRKEKNMREMLSNFQENSSFKPRTAQELEIFDKYFNRSQLIFKYLMTVFMFCDISTVVMPLLKWGKGVELPLKLYYPYDLTESTVFFFTYVSQFVIITFSIILNVTLDTIVYGILILTIGQFELFSCRLENCSEFDGKCIGEYIKHHVRILRLVKQTESFFMITIFPFFLCSLLIICTVIFQMAKVGQVKN